MLPQIWPSLRARLPFERLGELPTPVEERSDLAAEATARPPPLFVKRDDLTSPVYGGNKVRTLELLFGEAHRQGAEEVISTGAFGSNHAVATAFHAPRAGLVPGVMLFPQPVSAAAAENLAVVVSQAPLRIALPHWSALPFGIWWLRRTKRSKAYVMPPGGATALGALGYVNAAFELAQQVAEGELSRPNTVVIAVGSTCTTAGLLAGFHLAARRGFGFVDSAGRPAPPQVLAVRVTPWPVTSPYRIVSLAVQASSLLARLVGDSTLALERAGLRGGLHIDGRFLGRGYGYPTPAGLSAMETFRARGGPELDTTYSAKSAAGLLAHLRAGLEGPVVYWATKSTAALPPSHPEASDAPGAMKRWLRRSGNG